MVLHVRLTFKESIDQSSRIVTLAAIGDTVLVEQNGQLSNLTQGIPSKYNQITYTLDDEEDQKQPEVKNQNGKKRESTRPSTKKEDDDEDEEEEDESSVNDTGAAILPVRTRGERIAMKQQKKVDNE